jgi:hypothetical protein
MEINQFVYYIYIYIILNLFMGLMLIIMYMPWNSLKLLFSS